MAAQAPERVRLVGLFCGQTALLVLLFACSGTHRASRRAPATRLPETTGARCAIENCMSVSPDGRWLLFTRDVLTLSLPFPDVYDLEHAEIRKTGGLRSHTFLDDLPEWPQRPTDASWLSYPPYVSVPDRGGISEFRLDLDTCQPQWTLAQTSVGDAQGRVAGSPSPNAAPRVVAKPDSERSVRVLDTSAGERLLARHIPEHFLTNRVIVDSIELSPSARFVAYAVTEMWGSFVRSEETFVLDLRQNPPRQVRLQLRVHGPVEWNPVSETLYACTESPDGKTSIFSYPLSALIE
jgi:WD40 repeat protein